MPRVARPWITRPWINCPYLTAGVALAGAGALAVTSVTAPLPQLPHGQSPAVQLTAGEEDLLSAWVDQFNAASTGATEIVNNFGLAPGVALQQAVVNQIGYLNELINAPSTLSTVIQDIGNNLQTVLSSLLLVGASNATVSIVQDHTLDSAHSTVASLLPDFLPDADKPAAETLIQLLSSPASALLTGALGPVISPGVSLIDSAEAIVSALSGGDLSAALQALFATPADFVGSFFNGATLNLAALIPLIEQADILPKGVDITGLDYAFGGLLSSGSVSQSYDFFPYDSKDAFLTVPAVGGSIFNGLGLDTNVFSAPGQPVGPLSALQGLSQTIGALLGSGWNGSHAVPIAPLSTLTFPTLGGDDGLLSALVTQFNDASANLSALVDNFGLGPGVGLQQILVNQAGFLDTLINDPSQFPGVFGDIGNNLQTVLSSLLLVDASSDTIQIVQDHTLDGTHSGIASLLPDFLPSADKDTVTAVINLLSSPAGGLLVSDLGPVISPGVSLINSAEAIVAALQAGDTSTALQALLATPADFVGSFFNGATLNLDFLLPLLSQADILPKGDEITALSYAFGGLLSSGSVSQNYEFFPDDSKDAFLTVPAVGGSILNSLGFDGHFLFDGFPITLNVPGEPVGPIAALQGFSQIVGVLLGSDWDAKGEAVAPLAKLTFPTITDSGSAAAVSTDLLNALNVDDLGTADTLTALLSGGMGDLAALPDQVLNSLLGLF
ncbi:outer membrane porin GjpA [Mycobacterium sp.]|uniref:outer membrane porin GjpA n=1 Tax=Mycobacterium sp. TaxID=1785 RepID=UPI0031DC5642